MRLVWTPARRTRLNTITGGASGRRVKCEYEKDGGIYVNVDYLQDGGVIIISKIKMQNAEMMRLLP